MKSHTKHLQEYRDKSYVSSILCQLSSEYYIRFKNIFTIPLIISSSIMTILNSSDISADNMKISNVVINGCTVLLVALMNNSKVVEKANTFRSIGNKFNKLTHFIEDKLTYNSLEEASYHEIMNGIIKEYDTLYEALEYPFPERIKDKVKEQYKNEKTLPNVLNCVKQFTTPDMKSSSYDNTSVIKNSIVFANRETSISPIIKPHTLPVVLEVKKPTDYPIEGLQL